MTVQPNFRALAEYAAGFDVADVPPEVRQRATDVLLDTIAVTVAGSTRPEVRALARQSAYLGRGDSTVVGGHRGVSMQMAALVNGTAAVSLELDEGNQFAGNHPTAHMLPAVLAISEAEELPGVDVLAGLIAGYETAVRIGRLTRVGPYVHPFGTVMIAGTAAALCRTMHLDAATTEAAMLNSLALMVASSQSAATTGSTIRNLYTGMTNTTGLVAVASARAGQTTDPEVVSDVLEQILGTGFDTDALSRDNLGHWYLTQNYFKQHACSRWNHAPIEAAAQLRKQLNLCDIVDVLVETYDPATRLNQQRPFNWFAAKHSIPFNVASMLILGTCSQEIYDDAIVRRPDIRSLCGRVRVVEDPQLTGLTPQIRAARVTVRTTDGRELVGYDDRARGGYDAPFPHGWLADKCQSLIEPVLGAGAFERIRDECEALVTRASPRVLMAALALET